MAPETIGRVLGLCKLQDDAGRVLDGCVAVDLPANMELPSDRTYISEEMTTTMSRGSTPESMLRYGDDERGVREVRSGW